MRALWTWILAILIIALLFFIGEFSFDNGSRFVLTWVVIRVAYDEAKQFFEIGEPKKD